MELFKKVYIRSAADLPKEGEYFCNRSGLLTTQRISNNLPDKSFIREIRWYLQPITLPTKEEIEKESIKFHDINGGYHPDFAKGVMWLINKITGNDR